MFITIIIVIFYIFLIKLLKLLRPFFLGIKMGDETKPVCGKKLQTGLAIVFLLNVLWCKIARQVHGSSTEGIWIIFQTTCLLGEYRYLNTPTSRLFHLEKN